MGLSRREPRGGTIEVGHAVARLVRDFAWGVEFATICLGSRIRKTPTDTSPHHWHFNLKPRHNVTNQEHKMM